MVDFKANFAGLQATSAQLNTQANQIQVVLDSMDQQLQLLEHEWGGEAQEAYRQAKAKWTASMTEMRNILNQVSSMVDQSSNEYSDMDRRASQSFSF